MHRDDGHHARIHYHDERTDGPDAPTRARLLAIWQTLGPKALAACCGWARSRRRLSSLCKRR